MTTKAEQDFMIDCILTDLVVYLMKDYGMSEAEAMRTVYGSEYYERLVDLETGFYMESSAYNYRYLCHEMEYGKVV